MFGMHLEGGNRGNYKPTMEEVFDNASTWNQSDWCDYKPVTEGLASAKLDGLQIYATCSDGGNVIMKVEVWGGDNQRNNGISCAPGGTDSHCGPQ
ncbi:hypothetical protein BV898_04976 [Hypsibius exemplaris]|uniref:Uncharacterized protein n=1 Tax=Hypsibius exemplaris TaxID=2072580 RepID=A0A1W0X155_HYPEX|nr:hypothetical protein BV898_04976 [Hypsibius exemplaris]